MQTAVMTDRERAAVQAYLRLLHRPSSLRRPAGRPRPVLVPPSVLAEADQALADAGLAGNEEAFFRLLESWCPEG